MLTVLIDYDSGNLHSAEKAFQRMASEVGGGEVVVTDKPEDVARADRIVLPGDGAFPACKDALMTRDGLFEAIREGALEQAKPFMGICVGMQMMATVGREYRDTDGFGWVDGEVVKIMPSDARLKVPHMGWNNLVLEAQHPVLDGVETGDHAYFVHSYHMVVEQSSSRLAHVDYGGDVTAIVAAQNMIGLQFHPEKSQEAGLRMIANFLRWTP
ncbi:MAG: imidazole glycerol phosphate synthase subunit HisH [Pseudomonadota bacterium]